MAEISRSNSLTSLLAGSEESDDLERKPDVSTRHGDPSDSVKPGFAKTKLYSLTKLQVSLSMRSLIDLSVGRDQLRSRDHQSALLCGSGRRDVLRHKLRRQARLSAQDCCFQGPVSAMRLK